MVNSKFTRIYTFFYDVNISFSVTNKVVCDINFACSESKTLFKSKPNRGKSHLKLEEEEEEKRRCKVFKKKKNFK